MTKINLLPQDMVIKEDRPGTVLLLIAGGICAGILMGYIYVSKTTERKNIKNEILTVEKELVLLQTVVDKIAQIKTERETLAAKKNAVEKLLNTRLVYPIFMENFVKTLPQGMWLTELNTSNGDGITSMRFNAYAFNNYIIADLLKSFEQSSMFQNSQISGINSSLSDKGRAVKQFSITVDYKNQEWK